MKKCPPPRAWSLASSASSFAINEAVPPSAFLAAAAILFGFAPANADNENDVRPTAGAAIRSNHGVSVSKSDDDNEVASTPPIVLARQPHRTTANARPIILATSDAAAERSASEAALHRIRSSTAKRDSMENGRFEESTAYNANSRSNNNNNTRRNDNGHGNSDHGSNDNDNGQSDDSYPAFTPYHNSLLKKYLTPHLWSRLAPPLSTSHHTTIEDMIRPGVALPLGAHPPRRVGLLAGDAECYTVFQELIYPIVSEYHGCSLDEEEWEDPELPNVGYFQSGRRRGEVGLGGIQEQDDDEGGIIKSGKQEDDFDEDEDEEDDEEENDRLFTSASVPLANSSATNVAGVGVQPRPSPRSNLRRHSTIINNPLLVTSQQADPDNKYIQSTRIRIARSLDGVRFPTTMSRAERRRVQSLIQECCRNFQSERLSGGTYLPVLSMTTDQNLDLIERHILFDNPNEWAIAAGLGRDWPDGRGLYANVSDLRHQTPDFMIWVNEEDHLRIMCLRKGGDIQGVFTTLMTGVRELERELRKRGWEFAFHPKLGYLTSCPTNVGTTMRASVHVRLVKLGRLPGFQDLVQRLKLEVRGKYGETDRQDTGIFDVSNAERLGKSEVHLINVMVKGVAKLIELERRLERGEVVDCEEIVKEMGT